MSGEEQGEEDDYTGVPAEGFQYTIESSNNSGGPSNQHKSVTDNSTITDDKVSHASTTTVVQYHEVRGIMLPSSFGRSILQSPAHSTMVEEPIHVLSTPPTPPPRPPSLSRSQRHGPSPLRRVCSESSISSERDSNGDQPDIQLGGGEPEHQGDNGRSPPIIAIDIPGPLDMHILHIHANYEQQPLLYCLGSSIQHVAVDFVHFEAPHDIHVWYINPPQAIHLP